MLATFVTLVGKEVCVFHCISFAEAHCMESRSEAGGGGAAILGQSRAKFKISWKPTTIHGSLADLFETRRVLKHLAYFKDNIWLNLKRNSILDLYIYSKFSRYREINSFHLRSNLQNFHKTGHRRVILLGFSIQGPLRQHYFMHIYVYYCVNQGINLKQKKNWVWS